MKEFGQTASSKLSIKEFMSINLEEAHDPPSFTDKKKLEDHELKEIEENSRQIQHDIQQLHAKKTSLFDKLFVFFFITFCLLLVFLI